MPLAPRLPASLPSTHQILFMDFIRAKAWAIHNRSSAIHSDCEALYNWAQGYAAQYGLTLPSDSLESFGLYFVDNECPACMARAGKGEE